MIKTYYEVVMVQGSGKLPQQYNTYEEAYRDMCLAVAKEIENEYSMTLYRIERTHIVKTSTQTNTTVDPVWKGY